MRYTRASMLEVINAELRHHGALQGPAGARPCVGRHAFRNALIPIITLIGLSIPEIVGGAVVTESVFSWPGLGLLLTEAVNQRDFLLIMGITILLAIVVLMANLLTDVAYGVADPRIRYS